MEKERWTLTVEFDDLETQAQGDPEYTFPRDCVSRSIQYLLTQWSIDIEDFQELAEWDSVKITITAPALGHFSAYIHWVTNWTIPKKMLLERED